MTENKTEKISDKEINEIIKKVENSVNAKDAYFAYDGDLDETWIIANKEGLLIYSLEILEAAKDIENSDDMTVSLFSNRDESWLGNGTENDYIIRKIVHSDKYKNINGVIDLSKSDDRPIYKKIWDFICILTIILMLLYVCGLVFAGVNKFIEFIYTALAF